MDLNRRSAAFWTIVFLSACKPAKTDLRTPLTGPNDYTVPLTSAITPVAKPDPVAVTKGGGCENTPVLHFSDHEPFEAAIGNYRQLGLYDKDDPRICFPCIERGPKFSAKNTADVPFVIPRDVEVIEVRIRNCVSYPVDPEGRTAEKCGPIYAQYLDNQYGNVSEKMRRLLAAYATLQQETRDKCLEASQKSYAALSKVGINGLRPPVMEADGESNLLGNRVHNLAHSGQVLCELLSQPEFTDVREEADLGSPSPVDWTVTTLLAAAGISTIASAYLSHLTVQTRSATESKKQAAVDEATRKQRERAEEIRKLDEQISRATDEQTKAALLARKADGDYKQKLVEYEEALKAFKVAVDAAGGQRAVLQGKIAELENEIDRFKAEANQLRSSFAERERLTTTTVENLETSKKIIETRRDRFREILTNYQEQVKGLKVQIADYSKLLDQIQAKNMPRPTGVEDLAKMDPKAFDELIGLYDKASKMANNLADQMAGDGHQARKNRLGLMLDEAEILATGADGKVDAAKAIQEFKTLVARGPTTLPDGFFDGKRSLEDIRTAVDTLPQPPRSGLNPMQELRNEIRRLEGGLDLKASDVSIADLELKVKKAQDVLDNAEKARTNPALEAALARGRELADKIGPFGKIGIDDQQKILKAVNARVESSNFTQLDKTMLNVSELLRTDPNGLNGVLQEITDQEASPPPTSGRKKYSHAFWEYRRQDLDKEAFPKGILTKDQLELAQKTWVEIKLDSYLEASSGVKVPKYAFFPREKNQLWKETEKGEMAGEAQKKLSHLLEGKTIPIGPGKPGTRPPNQEEITSAEKIYARKMSARDSVRQALYKHLVFRTQTDLKPFRDAIKDSHLDEGTKKKKLDSIDRLLGSLQSGRAPNIDLAPVNGVELSVQLKNEIKFFRSIRNDIGDGNFDLAKYLDKEGFWKGFQSRDQEVAQAADLLKNAQDQGRLDEGLKKWQDQRKAIVDDLKPLAGIVDDIEDPDLKRKVQSILDVDFSEVDKAEQALDAAIAEARKAGPVADAAAVAKAKTNLDTAQEDLDRAKKAEQVRDAAIEERKLQLAKARQKLATASAEQRGEFIEEAQTQLKNLNALRDDNAKDAKRLQETIETVTREIQEFEEKITTTTTTVENTRETNNSNVTDLEEKITAKRAQLADLQAELRAMPDLGDGPTELKKQPVAGYDPAELDQLKAERTRLENLKTPDADARIRQIDSDIQARISSYRNYGLAAGVAAGAFITGAAIATYQNQRELDERYTPITTTPGRSGGLNLTGGQSREQTNLDVSYQLGLKLQETAQELSKSKRALGVLRLLEEELCETEPR